MNGTTRREVLGLAGRAAALLAAGRLPLLGSSAGLPPGVSPVQGYLSTHAPGVGGSPANKLRYSVLRWTRTDPSSGRTNNVGIGEIELNVSRQGDAVRIRILQTTRYSQPVNRLEADVLCDRDDLLSLRSWRVKSSIEGRDDCVYEAHGEFDGESIRIDDGMAERRLPAEGPLVCPWTLPLALARRSRFEAGGKTPSRVSLLRVSLLDDLLLYKPGQRIEAGPQARVPYQDGEHVLESWSHSGPAVLPLHYLVDDAGLPQLITQSVLAWALQEASA